MNEPLSAAERPTGGWFGLLAFLMVAGLALLAARAPGLRTVFTMERIQQFAQQLGWWGPLALAGLGLVMPLLLLPRWPVAFAAGLLYGIVWGTALALPVAVAGAWIQFRLARGLLTGLADRWRERSVLARLNPRPDQWFWVLFLLRCFPLSHAGATNLVAGSLRAPQSAFVWSALLGMIPSTMMYASWGKLMKKPDPWIYGVAVTLLAGMAACTMVAQGYWVRRLASETGNADA